MVAFTHSGQITSPLKLAWLSRIPDCELRRAIDVSREKTADIVAILYGSGSLELAHAIAVCTLSVKLFGPWFIRCHSANILRHPLATDSVHVDSVYLSLSPCITAMRINTAQAMMRTN